MKRLLLLLLAFLFVGISRVTAQTQKAAGIVVSEEDGLPVIGAAIQVKGTTIATTTDEDGKFTLSNIPGSARVLQISFIGMITQEIPISATIKAILKNDDRALEEVVVTGMTKVDRRLFTGATDQLSASNVKIDGLPEISRALEGRSAGVSVQNVSGTFGMAPKIRVRGATSIYVSSKPL
jgi:hypothetical protein